MSYDTLYAYNMFEHVTMGGFLSIRKEKHTRKQKHTFVYTDSKIVVFVKIFQFELQMKGKAETMY